MTKKLAYPSQPATVTIQNVTCIEEPMGDETMYRVRGEILVEHLNDSEGDIPEHVQSVSATVDGADTAPSYISETSDGPVTRKLYRFESGSPQPSQTFQIQAQARIMMQWDAPAEPYSHECP